jgi:hypothetical protein
MSEWVGPGPGMLQLKRMPENASPLVVAPAGASTSATKPMRQMSLRKDICSARLDGLRAVA